MANLCSTERDTQMMRLRNLSMSVGMGVADAAEFAVRTIERLERELAEVRDELKEREQAKRLGDWLLESELSRVERYEAKNAALREALREISKCRGHTVRSFEEIRDGWKDACVIAFGQMADIADAALNSATKGRQDSPETKS